MSEDRAVSTALSYVLTLAISAILITGLLIAGGSYVGDQRETVLRTELRVIGQQIATNLEQADRLVRASDTSGTIAVELTERFPNRIAGSNYNMDLTPGGTTHELAVTSTNPEVRVTISLATETDVGDTRADGGPIVVSYDTGSSQLVIGNE